MPETPAEIYEQLERQSAAQAKLLAEREHKSGHCVALVFTHWVIAEEEHVFFGPLVHALRNSAAGHGWHVFSCAPAQDHWLEEELVATCVDHGADALIVLGGADGNPDVLSQRWSQLPTVFVEYDTVGKRSGFVGLDNTTAFSEVVLHLAEAGRSRIAHITGMLDSRVGAERLDAYRSTLERLGYPVLPEYIETGDFLHESAYEAARRLVALPNPPDAIAAACDVQAIGALKAIEEAGLRCPDDIAVTGFDDADFASAMTPTLTTVRQPAVAMGTAALEAAIALIEDPDLAPPVTLLPGELIVRESSASAHAGGHLRAL